MFHKKIEVIKNHKLIAKDNRLIGLNPFVNQEGCLRVGGRLKHSNLAYEAKHQLILLAQHRLTKLIIEHEHTKLLHADPQATLGAILSRYWPLGARRIVPFCINAKRVLMRSLTYHDKSWAIFLHVE